VAVAKPLIVLLVEDNPGDADLTREGLALNKIHLETHVVPDGAEALAFLRREGRYAAAPRPDLILLDLNLPRVDGRQVLGEIKKDPILQSIPVVVMTSSAAEEDIARSYALHANSYVTKPLDLDQFLKVVASIKHFWLSIVTLPPH
jgi:CheY-like chemotaxis protein